MAGYQVTLARSARKEMEKLGEPLRTRVFQRIEALGSDPGPSGCHKLQGADDLWRIRIGDYRVIYAIDDSRRLIDISAIRHRSDVYR
ncbi:MAG: type II toxin-antitoxin system RelE/ParE family toxin [Acidobacteria bacterium]|nr:type II toxin-antitoxin system RelE/ParE family toxin [Acidobacteriota bacterium]